MTCHSQHTTRMLYENSLLVNQATKKNKKKTTFYLTTVYRKENIYIYPHNFNYEKKKENLVKQFSRPRNFPLSV